MPSSYDYVVSVEPASPELATLRHSSASGWSSFCSGIRAGSTEAPRTVTRWFSTAGFSLAKGNHFQPSNCSANGYDENGNVQPTRSSYSAATCIPLMVRVLTLAIKALCRVPYIRFENSLDFPSDSQQRVLRKLIVDLAGTEYGKEHGIKGNTSYKDLVTRIPIRDYEDFEQSIDLQSKSNRKILTRKKILHLEPTSGSSGAQKYIPYTDSLISSFSNMFSIWAFDHLSHGFHPETARIFISLSPPSKQPEIPSFAGKSPASGQSAVRGQMELANEEFYLREPLRTLMGRFLIMPPVSLTSSNFHRELAKALLLEDKLEVVSIWSPSYLLVLLSYIELNRKELSLLLPTDRRAALMHDPIDWKSVWPFLRLISCWDQALAGPLSAQIKAIFPHVFVQGKGLLATEAPITVPMIDAHGCVPLINEVFLEFETESGDIKLIDELTIGNRYQVIVSQASGLIRYRLNDIVQVTGFYKNTPTLDFVGRSNNVCDLVGEKLQELFVSAALTPLIPSGRFLLLPSQQRSERNTFSAYTLLTDTANDTSDRLVANVEEALRKSHHYNQARMLNQLGPLRHLAVTELSMKVQQFYQSEGMRPGDLKDVSLIGDVSKAARFLEFLATGV